MRILFVTSSLPCGAAETFLVPEIQEIAASGHEVLVVPVRPLGESRNGGSRLGFASMEEGLISWAVVGSVLREVGRGPRLPRLASIRRPRVSQKNLVALPKALRLSDLTRRWEADHVHAYWGSVPATVARTISTRTGVPWSFSLHRWDIYEDNFLDSKLRSARFARVISQRGAADVRAIAPGAPGPRVLHLGVRIPHDAAPTGTPRQLRALVAASMVPVKGHEVLLHALARTRVPLKVDLAGDGPLRGNLEHLRDELGLSGRVEFLGAVPHERLMGMMGSGDYGLLIAPSLEISATEHEGIPVALMEAMAAGIPVIGTRSGSIEELVDDDRGVLVDPGSVEGLATAIDRLASNEPLRRELSVGARAFVTREFDVRNCAATLADWIESPG